MGSPPRNLAAPRRLDCSDVDLSHAHHRFKRDQHYMVDKEKVIIIDEFTGRRMPDRHWQEGLHQAVEAKEGVPVHAASDHA